MRLPYLLPLLPLAILSSLAFVIQGLPHEGPATDAGSLFERDDTANYVVYPKDVTNSGQATAINTLLTGLVADATSIYVADTDANTANAKTYFWGVPLTSANAKIVGSNSNVAAIVQECTSSCGDPTASDDNGPSSKFRRSDDDNNYEEASPLVKRDDGDVNAHLVEPEVAFISWPLRTTLGSDFVYDKTAGTGQTVYIVDTGANLTTTAEFSHFLAPPRYLQARGAVPSDNLENDVGRPGHGTGMISKVAGWKHGVAKRSKPVIVRVSQTGDPGAWLDGVRQAYNDWLPTYNANPKTATAVINLSWGWDTAGLIRSDYTGLIGDVWQGELAQLLNNCIGIGLLPVVPSGNGGNVPVTQWPGLFAYPSNGQAALVPNMLLTGGVTVDGNLWDRSRIDLPNTNPPVIQLYAPSYDITVADAGTGFRQADGVSYAAATISGLGTYFLGLSSLSMNLANDNPVTRVTNLKRQLQLGSSLARGTNPNIRSLYNLRDPRNCLPGTEPPGFTNGDEVSCAGGTDSTQVTSSQAPAAAASTPASAPPARWSYDFHSYTGNIQSGNFSFFVLPGKFNGNYNTKRSLEERGEVVDGLSSHPHHPHPVAEREASRTTGESLDERSFSEESLDKRICCGVTEPPPPLPTTNGQVFVWTQSGSGAASHGPFVLDCTQDQDAWQSYNPSDIGLPYYLEIQSGHACAFDPKDDGNLDNLHVKYAAQYIDVPTGINDNQCVTHDNGVSCNSLTAT